MKNTGAQIQHYGNDSQTNNLIDRYLAERRAKGHEDKIVEHDLTALDLPVLDGELQCAARRGKTPAHAPKRRWRCPIG